MEMNMKNIITLLACFFTGVVNAGVVSDTVLLEGRANSTCIYSNLSNRSGVALMATVEQVSAVDVSAELLTGIYPRKNRRL